MKKFKRWSRLVVCGLLLWGVVFLVGCAKDASNQRKEEDPLVDSVGLAYEVNEAEKTCTITGIGTCTDTKIVIPKAIDGCAVTTIGDYAFVSYPDLTSITIPNSVTSIGKRAFLGTSLVSITIPDSVTSIGEEVFRFCTNLASITIPDSVTSIGEGAFGGCTSLTSITISASVTSIGKWVFFDCPSLISIIVDPNNSVYHSSGNCLIETASKTLIATCKSSVIPMEGSVTSIGDYAFDRCSSLTNVTIPNSVTSIGDGAFRGTNLASITIPDGVTSIGDVAFSECKSLTSIVLPDGVTTVSMGTFFYCSGLTSITIPNSVTSIGEWAFEDCTSLKKVYYTGTAEQWAGISIGSNNSSLTNATRYYYSETQPTTSGNYWRYVDGVPTAW